MLSALVGPEPWWSHCAGWLRGLCGPRVPDLDRGSTAGQECPSQQPEAPPPDGRGGSEPATDPPGASVSPFAKLVHAGKAMSGSWHCHTPIRVSLPRNASRPWGSGHLPHCHCQNSTFVLPLPGPTFKVQFNCHLTQDPFPAVEEAVWRSPDRACPSSVSDQLPSLRQITELLLARQTGGFALPWNQDILSFYSVFFPRNCSANNSSSINAGGVNSRPICSVSFRRALQ